MPGLSLLSDALIPFANSMERAIWGLELGNLKVLSNSNHLSKSVKSFFKI